MMIIDFNDQITELTERMDNQRTRYMEQFTAMESSVASFKKTGDLLANFMESWRASLKGLSLNHWRRLINIAQL